MINADPVATEITTAEDRDIKYAITPQNEPVIRLAIARVRTMPRPSDELSRILTNLSKDISNDFVPDPEDVHACSFLSADIAKV